MCVQMAFCEEVELDFIECLEHVYAVPNTKFKPLYSDGEEVPLAGDKETIQYSGMNSVGDKIGQIKLENQQMSSETNKMDKRTMDSSDVKDSLGRSQKNEVQQSEADDQKKVGKTKETGGHHSVDSEKKRKKEKKDRKKEKDSIGSLSLKRKMDSVVGKVVNMPTVKHRAERETIVQKAEEEEELFRRRHSRTKLYEGRSKNPTPIKRSKDEKERKNEQKKRVGESKATKDKADKVTTGVLCSTMKLEAGFEKTETCNKRDEFEEETEYFIIHELSSDDEPSKGDQLCAEIESKSPTHLQDIPTPLPKEGSPKEKADKEVEIIKEIIMVPDEKPKDKKLSLAEYKAKYMTVTKKRSSAASATVVSGDAEGMGPYPIPTLEEPKTVDSNDRKPEVTTGYKRGKSPLCAGSG